MKSILISLVSEQTLPNVLFIKKFAAESDAFCFLNTERFQMEGRVNWIKSAAGILDRITYEATLNPEDPAVSLEVLNEIEWGSYDKFIVNLTGGTKMMALATYAYFTSTYPEQSVIYYLPVYNNSIIEVYPNNNTQPLEAQINIREYLKSYGIQTLSASNLFYNQEAVALAKYIFKKIILEKDPGILSKIQNAQNIVDHIERKIYMGEWLEIWLSDHIKTQLGIPDENMLQGVFINKIGMPKSTGNEFDVIFCKNNKLYVGECKFYNKGNFKMTGSTGTSRDIFKLGNLRNHFGLHASSFIVTANDITTVTQFLHSCEFYGINKVADISTLKSENDLYKFIQNLI